MSIRPFVPPVYVDGIPVLVEESHALGVVDVVVVLRHGGLAEPRALEGLARMTARSSRMGIRGSDNQALEERIATLGGRLSIDVGTGHLRFHGTVIARNLEPFMELFGAVVREPRFRAADIDRVRREILADLDSSSDDDRFLAARAFRSALFGRHPLGRSLLGNRASLKAIRRADVVDFHHDALARDRMFVGFSGDITATRAHDLVHALFGDVTEEGPRVRPLVEPVQPKGLRIVVVDKPDRTQCQIVAGTLGSYIGDPLTVPLHVANTAFGGMFSGKLVNEIRVKRGYSYGAGSRVTQDIRRDAWTMSSFPTAEHAVDCARTMLELQEAWVNDGGSRNAIGAAKSFLIHGRCFEEDTPWKRLETKLDLVIHQEPVEHYTHFDRIVRKVGVEEARAAVRARISARDRVLTIVGAASALAPGLRRLPGLARLKVVSHRDVL